MANRNDALLESLAHDIMMAEEAERARQTLMIKNNQRAAALEKHDRAITQGADGRWRTRVTMPDGKTRMIAKRNRDDLLDVLVEHYAAAAATFRTAFDAWIDWKRNRGKVTKQTLTRYQTHFDRYFTSGDGAEFADRDLRTVTPAEIDELVAGFAMVPEDGSAEKAPAPAEEGDVKKSPRTPGLTGRQYRDLRIILRGTLTYARDHELIDRTADELLGGIKVGEINFRDDPEPTDPQVFTDEEEKLLLAHFAEYPTPVHLGLALLFRSGLRVGELSALRRKCVDVKNLTISIRATEVQYKDADGHVVVDVQDFPKTATGRRDVVLPSEAATILRSIRARNAFGEWFLCYPNGSRIHSQAFRRALRRACVAVGIPPRSTHKIRATYATELLDSDFSEAAVKDQLGHADVATTRRIYYRNRKTTEEIRAGLDAVFAGR